MPHEIEEELHRDGVDIFADEPAHREPDALGPMTREEAEDYLRQRNHLEHEIATIKAQADAMLSPVRAELNRLNFLHEHRLEKFIRDEAEATGKKTFPFWSGTCRLRKSGGTLKITDESAAMDYAMDSGWTDAFSEVFNKSAYKERALHALDDSGEVIPGVEIEPEGQSFSVSFKTKETPEAVEEE